MALCIPGAQMRYADVGTFVSRSLAATVPTRRGTLTRFALFYYYYVESLVGVWMKVQIVRQAPCGQYSDSRGSVSFNKGQKTLCFAVGCVWTATLSRT